MGREILMATSNPHKKEGFTHYLTPLGLSVVSFADIETSVDIVEDGKTPEENALKKARAGFNATGMTTFGVDYWFYIKGLSDEKQPGENVRRIFVGKGGKRMEATDDEILDYYTRLIDGLGGRTKGLWNSAIALITRSGKSYTDSFTRETVLTSERSPKKTRGEPLNSIQIDPKTGKYFTELSKDEWLKLQEERERGYVRFFESHLDEM
jgi:inosine/xanthosine triphosphate pyrophosphatase family protein